MSKLGKTMAILLLASATQAVQLETSLETSIETSLETTVDTFVDSQG